MIYLSQHNKKYTKYYFVISNNNNNKSNEFVLGRTYSVEDKKHLSYYTQIYLAEELTARYCWVQSKATLSLWDCSS